MSTPEPEAADDRATLDVADTSHHDFATAAPQTPAQSQSPDTHAAEAPPAAALRPPRTSRPHFIYGLAQIVTSIIVAAGTWAEWHSVAISLAWTVLWLPMAHAIGLAAGFAMAAKADPTPERRSPFGVALAVWIYECAASILLLDISQPWRSRFAMPAVSGPARPVAVLLLHGYGCNRAFWVRFASHLSAAGYDCDAITLSPLLGDIDSYADDIADATRALAERTRRPVVLIGHSMGGLAARACLRKHRTLPVAHTITLGTPHFGTLHAALGMGRNSQQMQVGSEWLVTLGQTEQVGERSRITSIYSFHDNVVYPVRTSVLPGAHNIALERLGHVSLGTHPRARAIVIETLERIALGLNRTV